jgi:hypothetical protein
VPEAPHDVARVLPERPLCLRPGHLRLGRAQGRLRRLNLREQGIDVDFSKIDLSQIDTVLNNLGETTIDMDDGRAQVRITCE